LAKGKKPRALRLRTLDRTIEFEDRIQGHVHHELTKQSGDFVIRRADGNFAYQLAVVVDDAFQKVTDVVRGADLLDSAPRQIWLQRCLHLPSPRYAHIPVVIGKDGHKLSKRLNSDPLRSTAPLSSLRLALQFLGHEAPRLDFADTLLWAIEHWCLDHIPRTSRQAIDTLK
jgi:glutamyl-Q tRNA(Asp) synthetase